MHRQNAYSRKRINCYRLENGLTFLSETSICPRKKDCPRKKHCRRKKSCPTESTGIKSILEKA